jgi:purine-binding chemotaxis protein CheW
MATQELTSKDTNQQMGITTDGSQFLTFQLGEELYGVDILRVQEIKGYTAVTRIPNTPAHIKGVLNLRGTIVPIVELRTKFGMPTIEYTMFTVIVVVVVKRKSWASWWMRCRMSWISTRKTSSPLRSSERRWT